MAFHLHVLVTVTLRECSDQHFGVILYPYSRPLPLLLCKQPISLNPTLYVRNEERTIKRDQKIQEAKHARTVGQRFGDCDFNPIRHA